MKRKVCQVGPATLMVSLPSKWAREYNVKKGDEIEVLEEKDTLIMGANNPAISEREAVIDARKIPNVYYRVLGAYYKAGYDKLKVIFNDPTIIEITRQQLARSFIGYEIIEENKDSIIIKKISSIDEKEFDAILKRCFMTLLVMSNETLNALSKKEDNLFKTVVLMDDTINKCSDFCRRIINKGGYKEHPPATTYFIAEQLEKIGDVYRDICRLELREKTRYSHKMLDLLRKINSLLRLFCDIFYKFDMEKMEKFIQDKKEIKKALEEEILSLHKHDFRMIISLSLLVEYIFDMNGSLITSRV